MTTKSHASRLLLKALHAKYPVIRRYKPLKIGTFDELASQEGMNAKDLKKALAMHTNGISYLSRLAGGGKRYALNGKPAGIVTQEEQDKATARVLSRYRLLRSRQAKKASGTPALPVSANTDAPTS